MKRSQPKRDWAAANRKREREPRCRKCGSVVRVELAHVLKREFDKHPPLVWDEAVDRPWKPYAVSPYRVIPLCGPATDTTTCHGKQHAGLLDVSRLLGPMESAQATFDAGTVYAAAIRLCPGLNPKRAGESAS